MPVSYTRTEDGGIMVKAKGTITGADLKEFNDRLYASPGDIQKLAYQICDLTNVTEVQASSTDVEDLLLQDTIASKSNPNMLIALVGDKDFVFGLSRMWETLAEDSPFEGKVFRKLEDAQQWIKERLPKKP